MEFALPDLAGVIAAGVLLLLACALGLLAVLIAQTFGRVPVIGSWVQSNIVASLTDAASAVIKAADASWHFAAGLFNWANDVILKPLIYTADFAEHAWQWLQQLYTVTIPDAEARAGNYALGLVQSANAYIGRVEAETAADLAGAVTAVDNRIDTAFASSVRYADGLYSRVEADLAADITRAEVAAATSLNTVAAELAAGTRAVEQSAVAGLDSIAAQAAGDISSLAGDTSRAIASAEAIAAANLAAVRAGIYTDLDTWGNAAVADAWPDAAGDIDALKRALGGDFPWLNDLAGALGGLGTAGLLGTLIRSMAASQAVTRLATDCTVPTCRNLSGLGNDLSGLAQLFSAGAIWAWLAFAVADPAGWATDTLDVLDPIATGTIDAAKTLFRVA